MYSSFTNGMELDYTCTITFIWRRTDREDWSSWKVYSVACSCGFQQYPNFFVDLPCSTTCTTQLEKLMAPKRCAAAQ